MRTPVSPLEIAQVISSSIIILENVLNAWKDASTAKTLKLAIIA